MTTRRLIFIVTFLFGFIWADAQNKFFTKSASIEFTATDDVDVTAKTRLATAMLDIKTGEFNFSVLVKSFEFPKAAMQEKFNNKILETDKYPQAEFKGFVENNIAINYTKDGGYNVEVKGKLTIHGITNNVNAKGNLQIANGKIMTNSSFTIQLTDYNVSNPGIGDGNIKVTVDGTLEPLQN